MTFGARLKALREQRGLTQAKLAEAAGISLGAVRNYEQGLREPSLAAGVKLARALGIRLDVLAEGVDWNDE